MSPILIALLVISIPGILLGLISWLWPPLAALSELRQRTSGVLAKDVSVSVVIPAYNEGKVLAACIDSVLNCGYPNLQVVVVNDGSTDDTWEVMSGYSHHPQVVLVNKANGGKGSALNAGIARATGDILIFVDADGLFTKNTIPTLLRAFRHEKVGAVCGNDQPINVTGPLTALLALMTHVGTGLTRRALALVGILPIVAGNSGAFRAEVVRSVGGFREDTVGEDLELTWRVQFAGWDVEFAPLALVLAEVPSDLRSLWKQRVRWQRGLIQTARIHRERLLSRPRRPIDYYLPINLASGLLEPVLQLVALPLLIIAIATGALQLNGLLGLLLLVGIPMALFASILALILDRAWMDFRHLILLPLMVPMTVFLSAVTARAIWLEWRGAASDWNKLERTGVKTVALPR